MTSVCITCVSRVSCLYRITTHSTLHLNTLCSKRGSLQCYCMHLINSLIIIEFEIGICWTYEKNPFLRNKQYDFRFFSLIWCAAHFCCCAAHFCCCSACFHYFAACCCYCSTAWSVKFCTFKSSFSLNWILEFKKDSLETWSTTLTLSSSFNLQKSIFCTCR